MYGLGNRDEATEMRERYNAMVNVLSDILDCGRWDIEDLFDSENNIEVGEIVKEYVEEFGKLPDQTLFIAKQCMNLQANMIWK